METKKRFLGKKSFLGLASLIMLVAIMSVPLITMAAGNRVYYSPDPASFSPAGSFGSMIPEGFGKGINKLTINAGPQAYTVTFRIDNNNNGTKGSTFFETRKGPGNNDLSGNVKLSPVNDFTNATNTTFLNFTSASNDAPLYVQVEIPPCGRDGTFRIQAHPGGTANQGNGPGVVVRVNCNGYIPPADASGLPCYDYFGNPIVCPKP